MSIRVIYLLSFISIAWAVHSPPEWLSPPHSAHLSLTTYPIITKTTSEWYFIIDTFLIDNVAIVVSHAISWFVTFLIVSVIVTSSCGCIIRWEKTFVMLSWWVAVIAKRCASHRSAVAVVKRVDYCYHYYYYYHFPYYCYYCYYSATVWPYPARPPHSLPTH